MDQPVQPELQQMFPPPPHFFSLYREDADGSAERPLPPLPPPIIDGSYQMFGEIHTTEDGMPPLQVRALYAMCTDGGIDFREELLSLHRELAVNYLELLAVLVEAPSSYARQLESVGLVLRNMLHLTNLARAVQARATLCKALRHSAEKKRRAAAELRDAARRMGEALDGAARSLEEAAALPLSGE